MNAWNQWWRRPQSTLLRRVLFQVHLWLGITLGLYILMISVTGSLLVYRREMAAAVGPVYVIPQEHRLTQDELSLAVERTHPGFSLESVFTPRLRGQILPNQAVEVHLRRGDDTIARLLDPYTGADLGDTKRTALGVLLWVVELHDNLLGGSTGRIINGIGAIFATLMACTGAILWWPGIRNWRRGLTIDWKRKGYGFHWSLHNAIGLWMLFFILMWGISGIYFSFPNVFNRTVDFFEPLNQVHPTIRFGDNVLSWLAQLHFGRFSNLTVKAIWTVLGLAPAVLTITGGMMWWLRVVRRELQRRKQVNLVGTTVQQTEPSQSLGEKVAGLR
jgi:uncharacterized iron-regulated membrane protein